MTTARPTPTVASAAYELLLGDAKTVLKTLPANSVQTCVTSPPYFGLRDYGTATWEGGDASCDHVERRGTTRGGPNSTLSGGQDLEPHKTQYRDICGKCGAKRVDQQIGIEDTPEQYVANLVDVFREVRRVLHPTGTIWINLGDSYARGFGGGTPGEKSATNMGSYNGRQTGKVPLGLKGKDLIGIPWMVAFALRADGWYLRSEIIWHKRAPMPESVTDRPTKAHEQVFLLAKSPTYFYDAEAIKEDAVGATGRTPRKIHDERAQGKHGATSALNGNWESATSRNKRSVWTLGPEQFAGAHFATMPTKLVEPCILAGTSAHGCCAACGAPWARQVEREQGTADMGDSARLRAVAMGHSANGPTSRRDVYPGASVTLGWQPTCDCQVPAPNGSRVLVTPDPVPCTVLDPFFGSGTVAAVALKHGRRFVGCDLDERNIALAHDRIGRSQPLLLQVTA